MGLLDCPLLNIGASVPGGPEIMRQPFSPNSLKKKTEREMLPEPAAESPQVPQGTETVDTRSW